LTLNLSCQAHGHLREMERQSGSQRLYGRIRAMFNDAGIEGDFHKGLWAECTSTATYYDNIIVKKDQTKSPLELMFKETPKELK
jgi:hypothetical protein